MPPATFCPWSHQLSQEELDWLDRLIDKDFDKYLYQAEKEKSFQKALSARKRKAAEETDARLRHMRRVKKRGFLA